MTIRELDPERDAPDIVEMVREERRSAVVNVASWLHQLENVPDRARLTSLVAVDGERVVGDGYSLLNFFTERSSTAFLGLLVRKSHRRRGIGGALYDAMVEHARGIGATGLRSTFDENDAGVAFARKHGFAEARAETESILDPRTVTEAPSGDVTLQSVRDVDPRLVYEVDVQATLDMPSTEQHDHMPYDEWEGHVLRNPLFTAEGGFVAIVDGVAGAASLLLADEESRRSANMFTGTLGAYRGRGLALAVKLGSIRWAAEHGIESMVTTNDETNAPMLAINRRLGYVEAGRRVEYLKELGSRH